MSTVTKQQARAAVVAHYQEALHQFDGSGLFGKKLDNKARKLALKIAGITLPTGCTIAWATPENWNQRGYRI
jgi:hypothetical protein